MKILNLKLDDSKNYINTSDNSTVSKETEISSSFGNQSLDIDDLNYQIIDSISLNLQDIINENKSKIKYVIKDIFYLSFVPPISLNDYIKHLFIRTKMNISTLIISIIYIDIFCHNNNYILTQNNIYRILLSTCLLSIKFNEDNIINNKDYSEISRVSVDDLKILEFQMYLKLHFSLKVSNKIYDDYYNFFSNFNVNKIKKV